MKKIFYVLLIAIIGSSIFAGFSYADKVLFFTPTRVLLNDDKKVEVMNISNLSGIARAYKVTFQDQVMTAEGYTTPVDNFEFSAKRLLRFVPREFVLQPGDRQTIRIMSRLRPDTADGEYHTHIRFLEDVSRRNEINPERQQGEATIAAPLAYEALIPAVISHGSVKTTMDIKDAKISKAANGEYAISLMLTRQGNGQGVAHVVTQYVAPDGSVTTVTPRRTVYIYRETNARKKDYNFTLPADLPKGGKLQITLHDSKIKDAPTLKKITLALP